MVLLNKAIISLVKLGLSMLVFESRMLSSERISNNLDDFFQSGGSGLPSDKMPSINCRS